MSPVGLEEHGHPPMHTLIPVQKGISLSLLVDFSLQKTYHDLTILSELLPRKSDIERKIEIIQFATKARQQFIRLLALVKWAASAEKVDKCQAISLLLDQQNAFFIDTADTLVRIARETLVQARLPNFSLPTAVDVLTTGTFNRLPKCIKTKIIPSDPVSYDNRVKTLKRLNAVIQDRVLRSNISSEFNKLKIGDGKLVMRVENEFEVTLMLMGDTPEIPWRLLNIEFLMEDYETGDGKSLVHGMQIHYIHQIVQNRLLAEEEPLCDLYKTLHYFCLALQLEVYYTQSKRLINQRWSDFVKIEEYVPGQQLKLSYCRSSNSNSHLQKEVYPSITVRAPKDPQDNLVLDHTPKFDLKSFIKPKAIAESTKGNRLENIENPLCEHEGWIHVYTRCLSVEKLVTFVSGKYSIYKLNIVLKHLESDDYLKYHAKLDENKPTLEIEPYQVCSNDEMLSIGVVQSSGLLKISNSLLAPSQKARLEKLLNNEIEKFIELLHEIRASLYLKKCRQVLSSMHLIVSTQLPITNISLYKSQLSGAKLYVQLKSEMKYCMSLKIDLDMKKNLSTNIFLLKLKRIYDGSESDSTGDPDNLSYIIEAIHQLDANLILDGLLNSGERKENVNKRKSVSDRQNDIAKRQKIDEDHSKMGARGDCSNSSLDHIKTIVSTAIMKLSLMELTQQLTAENVTFVENYASGKYMLRILEFGQFAHYQLKDMLVSCDVILDMDSNLWKVTYHFKKIHLFSNRLVLSNESVLYFYESDNVADKLLGDWEGLCKLFEIAVKVEETMDALERQSISEFQLEKYDMKSIVFHYGQEKDYKLFITYNSQEKGFVIDVGETGLSQKRSPHYIIKLHLTNEFNQHHNLHYILKVLHDTYIPLKAINSIPILPSVGRVLSVVNNFTFIANSSTHLKLIYKNHYILDIYLMESAVLVRDGTLYRTDSTKAMRGFSTSPQLNQFLQLFTDKSQTGSGSYEYPFTPAPGEFEQIEHYGPASVDGTSNKDRSMRSPVVVISSPQAYNQFTAPSPGNISSVPSPGTFIQPSPAPAMSMSAMSPSTWPGSPPMVQGSPRTGKQIPSSQSRQLLASINVSHSPVPVLLTHTEFQKLFVLKDHDTVHMKKAPTLCPLERFFGSVMLRAHLLRVLRTDETLKLEKNDHGVVVFSGAGKNGPETGLQYSVRLNQATMDSLLLKVTPMKGHESDWDCEDLRVLEHFFENKVVCPPYKICALTAFVRILGTYPKIMKDFIKIMRLELQTDWSKLLFKVEWCLIIPPSDIPSPALPGTPGVVLKNKNLIFLQLTEVKNEEHTVTVAILHDLKTNIVQHLDFPKHNSTQQQERETWAVKARNCFHNTLHRIQKGISQKEYPVYCAVYTVLMKMEVK